MAQRSATGNLQGGIAHSSQRIARGRHRPIPRGLTQVTRQGRTFPIAEDGQREKCNNFNKERRLCPPLCPGSLFGLGRSDLMASGQRKARLANDRLTGNGGTMFRLSMIVLIMALSCDAGFAEDHSSANYYMPACRAAVTSSRDDPFLQGVCFGVVVGIHFVDFEKLCAERRNARPTRSRFSSVHRPTPRQTS